MNPWVLLLLAILLYKLWQKVRPGIMDRYNQWQDARKEAEYAAQYHKNPDQFRQKMEAMDEARARLQDRYNQSTEEWVAKQRELEEKKRQQDCKIGITKARKSGWLSRGNWRRRRGSKILRTGTIIGRGRVTRTEPMSEKTGKERLSGNRLLLKERR